MKGLVSRMKNGQQTFWIRFWIFTKNQINFKPAKTWTSGLLFIDEKMSTYMKFLLFDSKSRNIPCTESENSWKTKFRANLASLGDWEFLFFLKKGNLRVSRLTFQIRRTFGHLVVANRDRNVSLVDVGLGIGWTHSERTHSVTIFGPTTTTRDVKWKLFLGQLDDIFVTVPLNVFNCFSIRPGFVLWILVDIILGAKC